MKQISAEIVADSINEQGDRITTFVLEYPRIIHAEVMTHRMFSRNAASSRAIPFERMVKSVQEEPFIPIAFQKSHSGMQGTEYFTSEYDINIAKEHWLRARDNAVMEATALASLPVTKQLCNRLLEPFQWYKVIVTATEYENFFKLRCPQYLCDITSEDGKYRSRKDALKDWALEDTPDLVWLKMNTGGAEIHISMLAEKMWDAYNENEPTQLKAGEWHIPFGDKFSIADIEDKITHKDPRFVEITHNSFEGKEHLLTTEAKIKIATARCARISYNNFEGKDDYEADIKLHNRLAKNGHASPFEHCARSMSREEYIVYLKGKGKYVIKIDDVLPNRLAEGWSRNFRGFIPYRELIERP